MDPLNYSGNQFRGVPTDKDKPHHPIHPNAPKIHEEFNQKINGDFKRLGSNALPGVKKGPDLISRIRRHVLLAPGISGTSYEGGSRLAQALYWSQIAQNPNFNEFNENEQTALNKVIRDQIATGQRTVEQKLEACHEIIKTDKIAYVSSGVYGNPGHFAIMKVRRLDNDNYAVYFINKGEGAGRHQIITERSDRNLTDARSAEFIIPQDKFNEFFTQVMNFNNPAFCEQCKTAQNTNIIYDIAALFASEVHYLPHNEYYAATLQRSGNCSEASFGAAFADALKDINPQATTRDRKLLSLKLKEESLIEWYHQLVKNPDPDPKKQRQEQKHILRAIRYQANRIAKVQSEEPESRLFLEMTERLVEMKKQIKERFNPKISKNIEEIGLDEFTTIDSKIKPIAMEKEPAKSNSDEINKLINEVENVDETRANFLKLSAYSCKKPKPDDVSLATIRSLILELTTKNKFPTDAAKIKKDLKNLSKLVFQVNSQIKILSYEVFHIPLPSEGTIEYDNQLASRDLSTQELTDLKNKFMIQAFMRARLHMMHFVAKYNPKALKDNLAFRFYENPNEVYKDPEFVEYLLANEIEATKKAFFTQSDYKLSYEAYLKKTKAPANESAETADTSIEFLKTLAKFSIHQFISSGRAKSKKSAIKGVRNDPKYQKTEQDIEEIQLLKSVMMCLMSQKSIDNLENIVTALSNNYETFAEFYTKNKEVMIDKASLKENESELVISDIKEENKRLKVPNFINNGKHPIYSACAWGMQNFENLSNKTWRYAANQIEKAIFLRPHLIEALKNNPDTTIRSLNTFIQKGLAVYEGKPKFINQTLWLLRLNTEIKEYIEHFTNTKVNGFIDSNSRYKDLLNQPLGRSTLSTISLEWMTHLLNHPPKDAELKEALPDLFLAIVNMKKYKEECHRGAYQWVFERFCTQFGPKIKNALEKNNRQLNSKLVQQLIPKNQFDSHDQTYVWDSKNLKFHNNGKTIEIYLDGRVIIDSTIEISPLKISNFIKNSGMYKDVNPYISDKDLPTRFNESSHLYYSDDGATRYGIDINTEKLNSIEKQINGIWYKIVLDKDQMTLRLPEIYKNPPYTWWKAAGEVHPNTLCINVQTGQVIIKEHDQKLYTCDQEGGAIDLITPPKENKKDNFYSNLDPGNCLFLNNGTKFELLSWGLSFEKNQNNQYACQTPPYKDLVITNPQKTPFDDPNKVLQLTNPKTGKSVLLIGAFDLSKVTENNKDKQNNSLEDYSFSDNISLDKVEHNKNLLASPPFFSYTDLESGHPYSCDPSAALYLSLKFFREHEYQLAFDYLKISYRHNGPTDLDEYLLFIIDKFSSDSSPEGLIYKYHFTQRIAHLREEFTNKRLKEKKSNLPGTENLERSIGRFQSTRTDIQITPESMRQHLFDPNKPNPIKQGWQTNGEYYKILAPNEVIEFIRGDKLKGRNFDRPLEYEKIQSADNILSGKLIETLSLLCSPDETQRNIAFNRLVIANKLLSKPIMSNGYGSPVKYVDPMINVLCAIAINCNFTPQKFKEFNNINDLFSDFERHYNNGYKALVNPPKLYDAKESLTIETIPLNEKGNVVRPPRPKGEKPTVNFNPSPNYYVTLIHPNLFANHFVRTETEIEPTPVSIETDKSIKKGTVRDLVINEKAAEAEKLNKAAQLKTSRQLAKNQSIADVKEGLSNELTRLKETKKRLKKQIIELARSDSQLASPDHTLRQLGKQTHKVKWRDIKKAFLKRDPTAITDYNPFISQENLNQIMSMTINYLSYESTTKQIRSAIGQCEKIENLKDGPEKSIEIDKLGSLLEKKREFNPKEQPLLLYFEAMTGLSLRKDQVKAILWAIEGLDATVNPEEHVARILQAFAGFGKTKVFSTIIAMMALERGKLPIVFQIPQLYDLGTDDLSESLHEAFSEKLEVFDLDIDIELNDKKIQYIYNHLNAVKKQGKILVAKPIAWHKINCEYKNRLATMPDEAETVTLKAILDFWRTETFNIYDEGHLIYSPLQDVTIASGKKERIPEGERRLLLENYDLIFDMEIDGFDIKNNKQIYASPQAKEEIKNRLIEHFANKFHKELGILLPRGPIPSIDEIQTLLKADPKTDMPNWIVALLDSKLPRIKMLAEEISLEYGFLSSVLPCALSKQGSVDYGDSTHSGDPTAAPKEKKNATQAQFEKKFIIAALTIQQIYQDSQADGLSRDRFSALMKFIRTDVEKNQGFSKKKNQLEDILDSLKPHPVQANDIKPDFEKFTEEQLWTICRKDPRIWRLYAENVALPYIQTATISTTSNPSEMMMQTNGILLTATPKLAESLPISLTLGEQRNKHKLDLRSEIETMNAMTAPRNSTDQSVKILDQNTLSSAKEFFTALYNGPEGAEKIKKLGHCIDGGKLFDSISETAFVEGYLEAFTALVLNESKIVVYTKKIGDQRRDFICHWDHEKNTSTHHQLESSDIVAELDRLGIDPALNNSSFTYYSIQETTGKDWKLPLGTHGIFTVGLNQGMSEAIQNFKRDRRALEEDKSVTYVMMPEIRDLILPRGHGDQHEFRIPSSKEIVRWMLDVEAAEMEELVRVRFEQGVAAILADEVYRGHPNPDLKELQQKKKTNPSFEFFKEENPPKTFEEYACREYRKIFQNEEAFEKFDQNHHPKMRALIDQTEQLLGTNELVAKTNNEKQQFVNQLAQEESQELQQQQAEQLQQRLKQNALFDANLSQVENPTPIDLSQPIKTGKATNLNIPDTVKQPDPFTDMMTQHVIFTEDFLNAFKQNNQPIKLFKPCQCILVEVKQDGTTVMQPLSRSQWDKIQESLKVKNAGEPNYFVMGNTIPFDVVWNRTDQSDEHLRHIQMKPETRKQAALILFLTEQKVIDKWAFYELIKDFTPNDFIELEKFIQYYSYYQTEAFDPYPKDLVENIYEEGNNRLFQVEDHSKIKPPFDLTLFTKSNPMDPSKYRQITHFPHPYKYSYDSKNGKGALRTVGIVTFAALGALAVIGLAFFAVNMADPALELPFKGTWEGIQETSNFGNVEGLVVTGLALPMSIALLAVISVRHYRERTRNRHSVIFDHDN